MDVDDNGPSWPDIATWYDQLLDRGSGPHETAVRCLLDLTPDLSAATVLDVACGQGLASRALIDAGASRVVGVDASEEMIALARRHDHGDEISYIVDDAQRLRHLDDARFDGATCQLGLMDIGDLGATLASISRVLRPSGWLVFVIAHPCFLTPDATMVTVADDRQAIATTGYFAERFWRSSNPDGVRRVGNYHRTLASYLNATIDAGFVLERVDEPAASPLLAARQPVYSEVPIFFAARVRNNSGRAPTDAPSSRSTM